MGRRGYNSETVPKKKFATLTTRPPRPFTPTTALEADNGDGYIPDPACELARLRLQQEKLLLALERIARYGRLDALGRPNRMYILVRAAHHDLITIAEDAINFTNDCYL